MALFGSFRARRRAQRAAAAFGEGGWEAAVAAMDGGDAEGWAHLAVALHNAGHPDEAERAVRRALELEPERGDALIFLAEVLAETGRPDEAIATYRRLLARFPRAAAQTLDLARLLAAAGDFAGVAEVLAPFAAGPFDEGRLLLAKARYELGQYDGALAVVEPLVGQLRSTLQEGLLARGARDGVIAQYDEAVQLYDEVHAHLHGHESVIEAPIHRNQLNARAAVNYQLLGEARMMRPRGYAPDPRLRTVEEGHAFGQSLIADGQRVRGLCQVGLAELRRGRFGQARARFDEARALDDDNFAAYLGLGAAMALDGAPVAERIAELRQDPDRPPPLLEKIVVDWPVLTANERRVVMAMAAPLCPLFSRIVEAGGVARLLPIDVLLTDLPEMAEGGQERHDDHRCLQAITGAASGSLCASKIEELLLGVAHDSVFAHELAHLAHHFAPDEMCARIDALYERALEAGYVITGYQSTNPAEFFAVAYTDYLAHLYELPFARELDEDGLLEETFALFRGG